MTRPKSWSLHWLTLAVLLPLLLLTGLAALGTRSQLLAAWAEARSEAERIAPRLAERLKLDFEASTNSAALYPDPPVPGIASPMDEILDRADPEELATLRNDPAAGLSPAGLPRRALAALALYRLDPAVHGNGLESILTIDSPSVLTSHAVDAGVLGEFARDRWREEESMRDLVREPGYKDGAWIRKDGAFLHLTKGEAAIEYVKFPDIAFNEDGDLPAWTEARLSLATDAANPDLLARAPVGLGAGLFVDLHPVTERIEAPVRYQQRWTFAILAASFVTAAIALAVLHRTLHRERQLGEMKSQFVASVSHELRAPVASIRLMADALEAEKVAPETVKEFHRLIAREGTRLSTLVANVLDHARIEQGRKVWNFEPCDLSALVNDTVKVMAPLAAERGVVLAPEVASVEAEVDADAMQQALVNLLDNAIKFSPSGGRVAVSLKYGEDRRCELAVADEGPGVPVAERERIFERFHRLGDELRRETQGTGIGLSLVRSIAEAHRGRVWVEDGPERGSRFVMNFPLSA